MTGPFLLGLAGGAVVLVAAVINAVLIRPDRRRYGLEFEHVVDGGDVYGETDSATDIRRLVADLSRLSMLTALGATIQFVALIWQLSRA